MTPSDRAAMREAAAKATPGEWYVGVQNDALFLTAGRAPAPNNDYPWHDAPRVALAKLLSPQKGDCLPVNAEDNARYIGQLWPERATWLLDAADERDRLHIENKMLWAGAEYARGALRALIPLIEALPGSGELVATINEAIVLSEATP